jgi:hypothetical protein
MTDKETLLVTSVWQYGGCSASMKHLCKVQQQFFY